MLNIKCSNGRYYIFKGNVQAYPFGFDSYVRAMLMRDRIAQDTEPLGEMMERL